MRAAKSSRRTGFFSAMRLAVAEMASGPCSPASCEPPPSAPASAGIRDILTPLTWSTRVCVARPAARSGGRGARAVEAAASAVSCTPSTPDAAGGDTESETGWPDRCTVAMNGACEERAERMEPSAPRRGSLKSSTARWLIATSLSPARNPAASAGVPWSTRVTLTGCGGGTPKVIAPPKMQDQERMRLKTMPAHTTSACWTNGLFSKRAGSSDSMDGRPGTTAPDARLRRGGWRAVSSSSSAAFGKET
eukprot:scaffold12177_cov114-Isochrysis_galbana.AAC.3